MQVDRPSGSARLPSVLVVCLAALTWRASFGLVAPDPARFDALVRSPQWIVEQSQSLESSDRSEAAQAVAAFRAQAGGSWRTPVDRRTGRALLFQGMGIALLPGAGNTLAPESMRLGVLDAHGKPTLEGIEGLARSFFEENRSLFLPDKGKLILNLDRSGILDDGRLIYADFDWEVDGVPVLGAQSFIRINHGNLVQAGTRLIGAMDTPTVPRLTASEAMAAVYAYASLSGGREEIVDDGRLVLLPVADRAGLYAGPVGSGVYYRLVWQVAFREPDEAPTWTARVDALTGEVLEFFDANQYAGQVTGGVYPRTVIDPEIVWPFPFLSVAGGGTSITDINGSFPAQSPGGDVSTGLDGRYFDTSCQSCTTPAQPALARTFGGGLLSLGKGGTDAVGNGSSTKADRNSFYHLNIVRLVAKKWLGITWLDTTLPSNVNINSSCNAFYNGGSVNFYRSSGTCNNTGEISDVMQHEWGHGLDGNTLPGDGATGEATADTVAIHVTHSPLIGPYFHKSGTPVRNVNKAVAGLLTTSNIGSRCPGGSGPLGYEVHCEGEIYGQTTWDFATALAAKYGNNTGWRESEHTFFTAMPQSGTYLPNQAGSIYNAYLAANDDDGNLVNGTPDGAEIYAAFNTHLIASDEAFSTPHCARPPQPVVTATTSCGQIALSWSAVPGAVSYRVQKHWQVQPSPFLNVATVAGTSYTDTQVTPGLSYHYVVQAVNASGCESSIETETIASPTARPRLEVSSVSVTDIPAGNRSGGSDPGESVDVTVNLLDDGAAAANGVTAVLSSSTAGVTVTSASGSYPDLVPGAEGASAPAYRIAIAGSVPCGANIALSVTPSATSNTCPLESGAMRLDVGVGTVQINDTFETNSGWAHDAASSTATTGAWVRGDPAWTNYQPGDDASGVGSNCWYTAVNTPGLDDSNDVDAGQVTLLSPVFNLAGMSGARVTYWRWFGQRDLGDDPTGDFMVVEVSSNGGSSWTALETLGDNVNAPVWTRKSVLLDGLVPLTAAMRFRVRVSDAVKAGDAGDIIEAAIDDFNVTTYVCDLTPPCFTAPTFAGLASVAPAGAACGQVDLSWQAAGSNCQNATMRYNVYRGTTPGFIPSVANRVATGLGATTYRDSLFSAGSTYYYVVRADDSRGGEDTNTVRRSVVAPHGPDNDPPVFAGVTSAASGSSCGEAALAWVSAQDCSSPVRYRVYRSTDAFFTPSPDTLIGETTGGSYTDAALVPNTAYTYVVRARDDSGNEESNTVYASTTATVLPRVVFHRDFESGPGGFTVGPDTATSGTWQLGDPVGTGAQPEDDTSPVPGVSCWATGLAGGAIGDNDVDGGATTLISPVINLQGVVNPVLRYQRWFSNDLGPNPAEDTFFVEGSSDGGVHYDYLDTTTDSSGGWQQRQVTLYPLVQISANMRFRFIADDEPESDSVVEGAIDDFDIIEPTGGCSGCPTQAPVGKISLTRIGEDVVISWASDPVSATRYIVYRMTGPSLDQPSRLGTTTAKSFTHAGAVQVAGDIFYLVSAVNACGGESARATP